MYEVDSNSSELSEDSILTNIKINYDTQGFDDVGEGFQNSDTFEHAIPHQCAICNKIFVNVKGLQQHSIIHTELKPFSCEMCGKEFRFKSNLLEHRSVHTGIKPYMCPCCDSSFRLKGNLKKHLKTHVNTLEELEDVWRPFSSNRRLPFIPDDALIVRGQPIYIQSTKGTIKKKAGLGKNTLLWVKAIRNGDVLPTPTVDEKMIRLEETLRSTADDVCSLTPPQIVDLVKLIPFESVPCPVCQCSIISLRECSDHIRIAHSEIREDLPNFCEVCCRGFLDRRSMEQHESYHKRVQLMFDNAEISFNYPSILVPENHQFLKKYQS